MSEPESRRWLVLSCMFWLGLMQAVGWVTYSANPQIASEYYGFENAKASIDMLLNWGPIMYLPVAPLVGYLIAKNADHLWHVILSGAVLTATGMVLRLMPNILGLRVTSHAAHACVHLGQALNGAAGPMNCVTPSALAALWFPSHQRAVATSVAWRCGDVGGSNNQREVSAHVNGAVMLLVQLVAFGIFTASLPDSPVPLSGAVTSSPSWLIAWLVVASVAEGAMAPMVYELSAELTYPHSEGVTGAAFSWLLNFWGFLLLWIFPLVPSRYDSLMMTGTCIVSLLLLAVVHAEYPRRRLDETDCQTTELLPSTGA
ncbi:Solute carrier family 49 member 4 homolog (Disrupted in renal carcinoma protein 2 homolog) [Durusdinium trenchii]|uniref:Solute carrier family 49 member 4 homolog (Disrupted in renal carcinoma protein 2 homolog) n=1 Tax=Durusdinium trenchii TaxID=1381693 RepID=A0ABP0NYT8_9DINO